MLSPLPWLASAQFWFACIRISCSLTHCRSDVARYNIYLVSLIHWLSYFARHRANAKSMSGHRLNIHQRLLYTSSTVCQNTCSRLCAAAYKGGTTMNRIQQMEVHIRMRHITASSRVYSFISKFLRANHYAAADNLSGFTARCQIVAIGHSFYWSMASTLQN